MSWTNHVDKTIDFDIESTIKSFYQAYWCCVSDNQHVKHDVSLEQDGSFYMPPDQKIRNYQEFIRSEQIEQMRLSKYEMYDLLLQPYQCDCVKTTTNSNQKEKYVYICRYGRCNRLFTKGWNILDHVRMHEDLRPYQCEFWSRAFTQKCNLTKHRQRHIVADIKDRKKFRCSVCDKGFTERFNLRVSLKEIWQRSLLFFKIAVTLKVLSLFAFDCLSHLLLSRSCQHVSVSHAFRIIHSSNWCKPLRLTIFAIDAHEKARVSRHASQEQSHRFKINSTCKYTQQA